MSPTKTIVCERVTVRATVRSLAWTLDRDLLKAKLEAMNDTLRRNGHDVELYIGSDCADDDIYEAS